MKIIYINPNPDEDTIPGCPVHWKDRGRRYFDYQDLWFDQLDRRWLMDNLILAHDQSNDKKASRSMCYWLGLDDRRPQFDQIGMITQEPRTAQKMVHRGIDFVFDGRTGLFFFDLRGKHGILMKNLLLLHTRERVSKEERASSYLNAKLGLFRSSQSPKIHAGQDMRLPTWAKHPALSIQRMD